MSSLIISSPNSVPSIKVGPFGGSGGGSWDDGSHNGIRRIDIGCDDWIHSIGCVYDDPDAYVKHGGEGGSVQSVTLDYPNEYIKSFSGHVEYKDDLLLVKSLTFHTNYNTTYGPYGKESGIPFSYAPENERIVGFHGRSGTYVDSIGVHMYSPSDNPIRLKTFGPFGGNDGGSWDDGSHYVGIRRIDIGCADWIHSIGCVYDDSDVIVKHGGGGGSLQSVTLEYPDEYIDSFSGHVGTEEGKLLVKSLTFHTSYNKTHGPFGEESGMTFSYASTIEKIVGFRGSGDVYVDSIGVHLVKF